MDIINVKQLRENFSKVKEEVEKGNSLLLLYRSSPLAEIRPVENMSIERIGSKRKVEEKLNKVKKLSGGLKLKGEWTPEELNSIYDKSYYEMLS